MALALYTGRFTSPDIIHRVIQFLSLFKKHISIIFSFGIVYRIIIDYYYSHNINSRKSKIQFSHIKLLFYRVYEQRNVFTIVN
jgi:hypothetical protein